MMGMDEQMTVLATPEGILAIGFFTRFSIIFAAYPVVMGLRITANEEDDGIMDVLLSLPLPRWRVILERFAAYVLTIFIITLMVYAGLWLGAQLIEIELDLTRIAEALFASIPLLIALLAFTAFSGALFPRRRMALAVATVFVVGSFVLDTVANMVQAGSISSLLGAVSVFSYFDVTAIVQNGLIWSHFLGLLIFAALLVIASIWLFQRRDVGV
jgi:ABC-2 type transport system permease protein